MSYTERLIRQLDQLTAPTMEELQTVLQSVLPTPSQYGPLVMPPKALPYGRHVLHSTDAVEAILIHLPAQARTAIHDHGVSIGCACVLEGEMANVVYTVDEDGYPLERAMQLLQPGEINNVSKRMIHAMVNPSPTERMVSLHLYTPPLRNIKTYIPYCEVLDYVI
jgi:cysteine dioxygenase